MDSTRFAFDVVLEQGYRFRAEFGEDGPPDLVVDETPPLGDNGGPNPARLLGLAIAHCLSASLLFCLRRKHRIEVTEMRARVEGTLARNERGRLRIGGIHVSLHPVVAAEDRARAEDCLKHFEDYCIVTESVRQGVDVRVDAEPVIEEPALEIGVG